MKYEKPIAEVIVFDNSDVITASDCKGNSKHCGGVTGTQTCNNHQEEKCDKKANVTPSTYWWT